MTNLSIEHEVGYEHARGEGEIVIINALDAALAHYTEALVGMLREGGATSRVISIAEPSSAGYSRKAWLWAYFKALFEARSQTTGPVISVWPTVGYIDFLLLRLVLGRRRDVSLIVHDPRPLVFARGYGRFARWLASRALVRASCIVHSDAALKVAAEVADVSSLVLLPHPVAPPVARTVGRGDQIRISVLGQYKTDRDLSALARIASEGPTEWSYDVVGRNWPAIPGWRVDSRFIAESEFDAILVESSVVLIPYRRFYQSGVAYRSLEQATPVVGPRDSSLTELLGEDSSWLVDGEDWLGAIRAAVAEGPDRAHGLALARRREAIAAWNLWIASRVATPAGA